MSRTVFAAWRTGALTVLWLSAALASTACSYRGSDRVLEIDARVSAGTAAQIYWARDYSFTEAQSFQVPVHPMSDGFETLRFHLPALPYPGLRFDPLNAGGTMVIRQMRVIGTTGETVTTIDPASMLPAHQIASFKHEGGLTSIVSVPGGHPILYLPVDALRRRASAYELTSVTPLSLAMACLLAAMAIAASGAVLVREAAGRVRAQGPGRHRLLSRVVPGFWLAALLLVVFALKLFLLRNVPAPVPFYDQWPGEASFYIAYNDGWLSWRAMFMLQNEHRWFFARLLWLGLFVLNGQWDPVLEQVVNALVHGGTAVVVASIMWVSAGCRRLGTIVLVCTAVFAPPFAWENTLFGASSQFYLLLLFTALAFWLVATHRIRTTAWGLGWICALCSLFTLAGGILTSVTLVSSAAVRAIRDAPSRRPELINVAIGCAVCALGASIASPPLAHHAALRAASLRDFVTTLALGLSWPWVTSPLLGITVWLPVAILVTAALRRREPLSGLGQLALIFGSWVALQAAALAYGRGANGVPPFSRYMDLLSWSVLVNAMAGLALIQRASIERAFRPGLQLIFAAWIGFQVLGIARVSRAQLGVLAVERQGWFHLHVQNVRRFIVTDDVEWFRTLRAPDMAPYPDPAILANGWLSHPLIRRVLPSDVRAPLEVGARPGSSAAFARDALPGGMALDPLHKSWSSFTEGGAAARGRFESRPLQSCILHERLRIEVAGQGDLPALYLALKSLRSGEEFRISLPASLTTSWQAVTVPCLPDAFSIVADDTTATGWLAFRDPVEISSGSARTEWLIRHSRIVQNGAATLLLISALLTLWLHSPLKRGRERRPDVPTAA